VWAVTDQQRKPRGESPAGRMSSAIRSPLRAGGQDGRSVNTVNSAAAWRRPGGPMSPAGAWGASRSIPTKALSLLCHVAMGGPGPVRRLRDVCGQTGGTGRVPERQVVVRGRSSYPPASMPLPLVAGRRGHLLLTPRPYGCAALGWHRSAPATSRLSHVRRRPACPTADARPPWYRTQSGLSVGSAIAGGRMVAVVTSAVRSSVAGCPSVPSQRRPEPPRRPQPPLRAGGVRHGLNAFSPRHVTPPVCHAGPAGRQTCRSPPPWRGCDL
jgi:hypothetical protein